MSEPYRMSDIRQYLNCRRQFYLSHTLGLRPRHTAPQELSAADIGTLAHAGLAGFYEGEDPLQYIEMEAERMRVERDFDELTWANSAASGVALAKTMLTRYQAAPAHVFEIDLVQGTEVELKMNLNGYDLVGHIDLILEPAPGVVTILDHKTVKQFRSPRPNDFQLVFYSLLYYENYGVVPYNAGYNLLKRVGKGKAPFLDRRTIAIEEVQLKNMADMIVDILDETATRQTWPNMTNECDWKCNVKDLCDGMDDGSDWQYTAKVEFTTRKERNDG